MRYDVPAWEAVWTARDARQPALALARTRRLLAELPEHWPARVFLGEQLVAYGRVADARDVLDRLAADPQSRGRRAAWLVAGLRGELHERAREPALALAAYAEMRALDPGEASGYVFAGGLLARTGALAEAEVMHRAGTACTDGAVDESWFNLGLVLRARERNDEAAAALEQALALDPDYHDAHGALADVRVALAIEATAPPSWDALVEAWGHERVATGLVLARQYLRAQPGNWVCGVVLAEMLAKVGRAREARAILDPLGDALLANVTRLACHLAEAQADACERVDDIEAALRWCERLRDLRPANADGFVTSARLLWRVGRLADAAAMYEAGTGCATGEVTEAWLGLGLVRRAEERHAEARVALERALALDAACVPARTALADVTAALELA